MTSITAQGTGLAELQLALELERKALEKQASQEEIMFSNAQVSLINLTDQLSKAHNDRMAFLDARIAAITALIGGAAR